MKTIIKSKIILDRDDLSEIQEKLRDKGTSASKFLYSNGLSLSYLNTIVTQENDASYIVSLLRKNGIRLSNKATIHEN